MRIEYLLTSKDYVQFYLYCWKRKIGRSRMSPSYLANLMFAWLLFAALIFGFSFAAWEVLALCGLVFLLPNRSIAEIAGISTMIAVGSLSVPYVLSALFGKGQSRLNLVDAQEAVQRDARSGRLEIDYSCE
jgi:hypothetical protein